MADINVICTNMRGVITRNVDIQVIEIWNDSTIELNLYQKLDLN